MPIRIEQAPCRPRTRLTAGFLAALYAVASALAAGRNPPRTPAELMLDAARDYGLSRAGHQTPADVLQLRTLLQAAVRLDPTANDARIWLYELALLAGDRAQAADWLTQIVTADPGHEGALSRLLDIGARAQTVEQQSAWVESLLERELPPASAALVYAELARLALQRLDPVAAQGYIDQAKKLCPYSLPVARAAAMALPADAPPAQRIAALLDVLRLNPTDVETAWRIGLELDECGFVQDANVMLSHATRIALLENPDAPLPAERLVRLAVNALARGDTPAAARYAGTAAAAPRQSLEPVFLAWWVLNRGGERVQAAQLRALLSQAFAQITDPDASPLDVLAQAAWFHCRIDPQPERALKLAQHAAQRAPHDPFVQRVLGWAQALNHRDDEARSTLERIAKVDPFAAAKLAEMARAAGDEETVQRIVSELKQIPGGGPAREMLAPFLSAAASQPASERLPKVVAAIGGFDPRGLDFDRGPDQFLHASITLPDLSPETGEPWLADFELLNRAPFPITLGPEGLVNPVFLVSLRLEGEQVRDFPDLLTVSLDRSGVLPPGASVRVRRTLDVGPPRRYAQGTPGQLLRVTVTAILDPRQGRDGTWQPSLTGQAVRPAAFNRLPARSTPEFWNAKFAAFRGESQADRLAVMGLFAAVLGDQQRAAMKGGSAVVGRIPAERFRDALRAGLLADSWELRAQTLDALQAAGLDAPLVEAAKACLTHPHWAVRLLALRLLARQGPAFADTARRINAHDADELVRTMAQSYLEAWSPPPPTTQPTIESTSQPASRPAPR